MCLTLQGQYILYNTPRQLQIADGVIEALEVRCEYDQWCSCCGFSNRIPVWSYIVLQTSSSWNQLPVTAVEELIPQVMHTSEAVVRNQEYLRIPFHHPASTQVACCCSQFPVEYCQCIQSVLYGQHVDNHFISYSFNPCTEYGGTAQYTPTLFQYIMDENEPRVLDLSTRHNNSVASSQYKSNVKERETTLSGNHETTDWNTAETFTDRDSPYIDLETVSDLDSDADVFELK